MDQWLDSLSEDWVSQPRSQHSSSVLRDLPSPTSIGSQSRIPRYKPRSASNLSATSGRQLGADSARRSNSTTKRALQEQSCSEINSSHRSHSYGDFKPQGPGYVTKREPRRDASVTSTPPIQQDTVQYKSTAAENQKKQATPEWKRRMLKGKAGGGDQLDLFGPIGLEGVFKPPTLASRVNLRQGAKRQSPRMDDFPSTPPVYSNRRRDMSGHSKPDQVKATIPSSPPAEIYDKALCETASPQPGPSGPYRSQALQKDDSARSICLSPRLPSNHSMGKEVPSGTDTPTLPKANVSESQAIHTKSGAVSARCCAEQNTSVNALDQSRNENISPFYVSKHNTVDGRYDYAAIDMSMQRLHSNMDKLRLQQQNLPSSRSSDHGIDYADSKPSERTMLSDQLNEITSQSLPEDLSVGTDAFAANGGFISIRRGGYSNEGSFQRRQLSPSSSLDLDGPSHLHTSNTQIHMAKVHGRASSELPLRPSTPPKTPRKHEIENCSSHDRPRSSGSPLKLFDKYDTFTNERLVRRMSKFEETHRRDLKEDIIAYEQDSSTPSPGPKISRQRTQLKQLHTRNQENRISSFGEGELEGYSFSDIYGQQQNSLQLPCSSPNDVLSRNLPSRRRSGKRSADRQQYDNTTKYSRDELGQGQDSIWRQHDLRMRKEDGHNVGHERDIEDALYTANGKRPAYSPVKDPAPKRRRTLRTSEERKEETVDAEIRNHFEAKEAPASTLLGRKRKDARYDNDQQAADPKIIAMRQKLCPRTPLSNQNGCSTRQTPTKPDQSYDSSNDHGKPPVQREQDGNVSRKVDPPTQIVAGALATVALNTVQNITNGSRKASVTTADFFNEAQQIMMLIRAEKRPGSSHPTLEESEVHDPTITDDSIVAESTKDDFSRPPSRDGGSLRKLRAPAQLDARVVSHLRKFEDVDDLGLALSSSLKSLKICNSNTISHASDAMSEEEIELGSDAQSDPPNLRILERRSQQERDDMHDDLSSDKDAKQKVDSRGSSGQSTERSVPTGSSRSSGNKMVIAPETVAHLLSDQMAGMVFDRDRKMWVKRKGSAKTQGIDKHGQAASEGTEDDLFGDIPDLSVNEMEELKLVKDAVSHGNSLGSGAGQISNLNRPTQVLSLGKVLIGDKPTEDVRPRTAEGKSISVVENSSAPSKFSHFASSGPIPGTRATSWGDDVWPQKQSQPHATIQPLIPTQPSQDHEEEVEHEISILEGRISQAPAPQNSRHQARVVTVAFSSPLVDQAQSPYIHDEDWEGDSELRLDESPSRQALQPAASTKRRTSTGFVRRSSQRGASRRMSIGNSSYVARPMSRLDERDELSLIHCSVNGRRATMEVAISTPLPTSRRLLAPPTTGQLSSVGFDLSPLPDFTVNQLDNPIDHEYGVITKRSGLTPCEENSQGLSLTGRELVKHLTDIEPYEPYWEYIRTVVLRERGLASLHLLDSFCGRTEELDASNNQIRELSGIPSCVRSLNIRGNCLSDLTSWHHLQHLQYLDVSGNQLRSLKGLHGLQHLRALKVDKNEIESLDGLQDLDGLLSLTLRGNEMRRVDFAGFNL